VVSGFSNLYTNNPNPIGVFTYPDANVPLNITYNGKSDIPSNIGSYVVNITIADNNYCYQQITGIYYISGNAKWQSAALGWGRDVSTAGPSTQYGNPTTGLIGVQKIVGGKDFSLALMNDNKIITWGSGNQYKQQDIPNINNYIKDIAASNNTTFIIDWDDNLTGCGYLFNSLGNSISGISGIVAPNTTYLTGILGVSAADNYAIIWKKDKKSKIYGWGNPEKALFNFSGLFDSTGIDQVCATNYGYVLLSGGTAVAYGSGVYGQFDWPMGSNQNIKKISCSDSTTVFLYENKTITGFGKYINSSGDVTGFFIPDQSVQGKILDISAGKTQTLLILDSFVAPYITPHNPPECYGINYSN
jgi:alpha-tubulin suppressor-like RCC1 family protein